MFKAKNILFYRPCDACGSSYNCKFIFDNSFFLRQVKSSHPVRFDHQTFPRLENKHYSCSFNERCVRHWHLRFVHKFLHRWLNELKNKDAASEKWSFPVLPLTPEKVATIVLHFLLLSATENKEAASPFLLPIPLDTLVSF